MLIIFIYLTKTYTVKKKTQAGLANSEEVILAVNAEKTKYVYVHVSEQNCRTK
jgi:hypothetical protein